MKTFVFKLIIAAIAALISGPALASDPLKVSIQTGIASQHLFTDGISLHNRPVEQLAILAKLPYGLMAGVWSVSGLDDLSFRSNGGDELVVGAGWYAHTEHFVLEAGLKHHMNAGVRGQTTIPEFELGYVAYRNLKHKLEPYLNLEFPISHAHVVAELSAGTEHAWKVLDSLTIKHRLAMQFNSSAHGRDEVLLATYRLGLAWTLLKREHFSVAIIGPTVRLYAPIGEVRGYQFQQAYGATVDVSWQQ
jgi:hypothetical protein